MTENTPPWYTKAEIDELCEGLEQQAAKIRYLRSLGLTVTKRPSGGITLMRDHASMVLSGMKAAQAAIDSAAKSSTQPDRGALVLQFNKGGA